MSHLQVFYGHFTTRTIVDHRTWISEKPLKNHRCQWSICKKTFNGDGQGVAKPLKNHRWQWCPGKKNITIASFEKDDHRRSLSYTIWTTWSNQSSIIYFEGSTIHYWYTGVINFLLLVSVSLVSLLSLWFSGCALAHREPKSLRNLFPGAHFSVHLLAKLAEQWLKT